MSSPRRTGEAGALWGSEAAQWWTLLHGEEATVADRREFLEWVARSPERIEAYLAIERLMTVLRADTVRWPDTPAETLIGAAKSAREAVPLSGAGGIGHPPEIPRRRDGRRDAAVGRSRRLRFVWGAALGVAATALAAALALWLWMPGAVQFYHTRAGEQRSILLADGSRVTLNSASTVEVELGKRRRIVRLLSGEALFQVSHDPARPFDVYADGAVVRAIGTEFNVNLTPRYAEVTVLEGRVAVMSEAQATVPLAGAASLGRPMLRKFPAPAGAMILGVAQQVLITSHGMHAPRPVNDLAATTAWTRGQLVFEHRPLGEVVDEFDRDGGPPIELDSAALRARRVTGVIQMNDPQSLLEFLSDVPGVVIRHASDGTSIVTIEPHVPARSAAQRPGHGP